MQKMILRCSAAIVILALLLVIPQSYARHQGRSRIPQRIKRSKNDKCYRKEKQEGAESKCMVSINETYESIGCNENEYCLIPDGRCYNSDENDFLYGTCHVVTHRCTREYKPVCGCNGRSYANRCIALSNGVSVKHNRPCLRY